MARSIEEINKQITDTKNTYLPNLNSASKVSVFGLLAWIFAVGAHYLEVLLDVHKKEVQDLLDNRQPATKAWYAMKTKAFQLGDNIDGTGNYPTVNTTKQIVSRCAVKETKDGEVVIKVAKGNVGKEEPLSASEKLQLDAYIDKVKYAGTKTEIVSLNSDYLNLVAEVFYDPIYTLSDVQTRLESALYDFMSTIDFGGIVSKNALTEKVREVAGIRDIVYTTLEGQAGTLATAIDRNYEMVSGYIKENVTDYPFATNITYTPEEE